MKFSMIIVLIALLGSPLVTLAQQQEAQQLLLNVVKLAELKSILDDLKKGYQIITKGYGAIKNISKGNFSLHKEFLDNLLQVNPAISKYKRVNDIVQYQLIIVRESRSAKNNFVQNGLFSADELGYLTKVYSGLYKRSYENLDELLMVITTSKLRMSDEERLTTVDRIFHSMEDQLSFLKDFNTGAKALASKRLAEAQNIKKLRELYQLK